MVQPITWRNIATPNFSDVNQQFQASTEALSRGLGTLQNAAQRQVDLRDPTSQLNLNRRQREENLDSLNLADARRQFSQDLLNFVGSTDSNLDLNAAINSRASELGLGSDAAAQGVNQVAALRESAGINAPTSAQAAQNQMFEAQQERYVAEIDDWADTTLYNQSRELGFNPEIEQVRQNRDISVADVASQLNKEGKGSVGQDLVNIVTAEFEKLGAPKPTGAEIQHIFNMAGYDNWGTLASAFTDDKLSFDNGDITDQAKAYIEASRENERLRPEFRRLERRIGERADQARSVVQQPLSAARTQQQRNRALQFQGQDFDPVRFSSSEEQFESLLQQLRAPTRGAARAQELFRNRNAPQQNPTANNVPAVTAPINNPPVQQPPIVTPPASVSDPDETDVPSLDETTSGTQGIGSGGTAQSRFLQSDFVRDVGPLGVAVKNAALNALDWVKESGVNAQEALETRGALLALGDNPTAQQVGNMVNDYPHLVKNDSILAALTDNPKVLIEIAAKNKDLLQNPKFRDAYRRATRRSLRE